MNCFDEMREAREQPSVAPSFPLDREKRIDLFIGFDLSTGVS